MVYHVYQIHSVRQSTETRGTPTPPKWTGSEGTSTSNRQGWRQRGVAADSSSTLVTYGQLHSVGAASLPREVTPVQDRAQGNQGLAMTGHRLQRGDTSSCATPKRNSCLLHVGPFHLPPSAIPPANATQTDTLHGQRSLVSIKRCINNR